MNICPITYEPCAEKYSRKGINKLSRNITEIKDFPYTTNEQLKEAAARADKMSIQGVQPKLSARFSGSESSFVIVNKGGAFILKPGNPLYNELPRNEDLTMRLAEKCGIDIPFHGLIFCRDSSLTYFIKRFDRAGRRGKIAIEDFAQLTNNTRDTKYNSSMERVAEVIEDFCTFPVIEKIKLFRLTIFNFLTGNEDMHLKNFSLIDNANRVELSPSYDLLNTTIALDNPREEIALPLGGKKNKITRKDLVEYYGIERLGLENRVIIRILKEISDSFSRWENLIKISFLSGGMKDKYICIVRQRSERLYGRNI